MRFRSRDAASFPLSLLALLVAWPLHEASGDDPGGRVNPVPETREALKQALEDSKNAEPRLPLPPMSDEETLRASQEGWGVANNGRMRRYYLPPGLAPGGFPARDEPGMTLGYPFQTMLFWIVSRANNCTYCLGHQESKLAAAGVGEDRVALLDGDWAALPQPERAAFTLARAMTLTPHDLKDEHIDFLRLHYSEPQIAEMLYVVSSFNAMNRWTGALNIPQEHHRTYLTPLDPSAASVVSTVAPLGPLGQGGGPRFAAPQRRGPLESREEVESILSACRDRSARVALVDAETTQSLLLDRGIDLGPGDPPHWVRLLAHFPGVGLDRVRVLEAARHEGTLDPMLRARVSWVSSRHDRAWYALGHARQRLHRLGLDDDAIFAMDTDRTNLTEADRLALAFAERLTVDPALVSDEEVAGLREHLTDPQVAELVAVVAEAVFMNRLTEGAGLPLE